MCTVTFIPLIKEGYVITSNRDEKTSREQAVFPTVKHFKGYDLLLPRDPQGGGTWIAMDNLKRTVCLLNGAYQPHQFTPPYRHSRGLVVIDFFKFKAVSEFVETYDFRQIEPFTLVIVQDERLFEFRWDGENKYFIEHSFEIPKIWSSVTLYNADIIKKREIWFNHWLKENANYNQEMIIDFHTFAGEGDTRNDVLMEREDHLKTVSISSVLNVSDRAVMTYFDRINDRTEQSSLNVKFSI